MLKSIVNDQIKNLKVEKLTLLGFALRGKEK